MDLRVSLFYVLSALALTGCVTKIDNSAYYDEVMDDEGGGADEEVDDFILEMPASRSADIPLGTIPVDTWKNVPGGAIRALTMNLGYPHSFDEEAHVDAVDFPDDAGDRYGRRIYGLLEVTEPSKYTFRVSADHSAEIWLSDDENPLNKRLIAFTNNPTGYNVWNTYRSQTSAPILLEPGKAYYMEILHKEKTERDYLRVEWKKENSDFALLTSANLYEYQQLANVDYDQPSLYHDAYHAGYYSGLHNKVYNPGYPLPDKDGDGLPDFYEVDIGTSSDDSSDAFADKDGDGLHNYQEYQLLSDANDADTDGDLLPDGYEVSFGLNLLSAADAALDLDGDGYSNVDEYLAGTLPNDPTSVPAGDIANQFVWPALKTVNLTWQAPMYRADGSQLPSSEIGGYKIYLGRTKKLFPNSTVEVYEANQNSYTHTLPEGTYFLAMSTITQDGTEGRKSEAQKLLVGADSDNDMMPDNYEGFYGLNPCDPTDARADLDGDGIPNFAEYIVGTPPNVDQAGNTVRGVPASQYAARSASSSSSPDVTITWDVPTARSDGSKLAISDIKGYNIYYGASPEDLGTTVNVADSGQTSYIFNTLSAGTYYFAISTLTNDGLEGSKSDPVSTTLGATGTTCSQ